MLYEYNGKFYVKPFSNRLVEVEIFKKGNEYDVKATKKVVEIRPEIKNRIAVISLKEAYEKKRNFERKIVDEI